MRNDPTITRIREIRHQISKKFEHNPKSLVEYYLKLQKSHQDRLVDILKVNETRKNKIKFQQGT